MDVIATNSRLYSQLLSFITLLPCYNLKRLRYINYFCYLLIALILLATLPIYAANENCQNTTTIQPIVMLLNKPNYLDECLTVLRKEPVIKVYDFLKAMMLLEDDEGDDGEKRSVKERKIICIQRQYPELYNLYSVLSLRYYQGTSFTDFMNYIIHNKPAPVVSRPLMEAMLKLCDCYKARQDIITVGSMLEEVEKQKHTDDNINAFLRYKANNIKAQCEALYIHSDNDTKNSADSGANKKNCASWFSRCSQKAVSYAQRIVKNVSGLAPKAMYTAPLVGYMVSPVGADDSKFQCPGAPSRYSVPCDGFKQCPGGFDELITTCCKDGIFNATTRTCPKYNDPNSQLLVCYDNRYTIPNDWYCERRHHLFPLCPKSIGDISSICCEDGASDINNVTRICTRKGNPAKKVFICENNEQSVAAHWLCTGSISFCSDFSDQQASNCCENGILGINYTTKTCPHAHGDSHMFVCDNQQTLDLHWRCKRSYNPDHQCRDKSNISVNGTNPTCFSCSNNNALILAELQCNGEIDCSDGSDEQALDCCEGWSNEVNNTTKFCIKKGDLNQRLFVCDNGITLSEESLCNSNHDCSHSSNESFSGTDPTDCYCRNGALILNEFNYNNTEHNCHGTQHDVIDSTSSTTGLLLAGTVVCVTYAAMLVKYRKTKTIKGTLAWLLSPITEPVNYLRSYCKYRRLEECDEESAYPSAD
ncbi:MAG: hypothetical protein QS721_09685 [Candidatus Endonucleobacter sp. (ex Gigantidas childressi)]|nr:hypothetical protein [Candidatus Endonucleobacter sp. (ex Gigantidas childressi)]